MNERFFFGTWIANKTHIKIDRVTTKNEMDRRNKYIV